LIESDATELHEAIETGLIMHTEVYAKRRRSAQTETIIPIDDANNYFSLLPEHFTEITKQWLSHVATQSISGNGLRLLTSIYRYTTGFNKYEDDMSGTRLEQISLIRSDHANHTLRLLAADHAVICRKGVYGQIVSINFDFASWGKMDTATNTPKVPKFVKDPCSLLPSRYRDKPIDAGNIVGAEPIQEADLSENTNNIAATHTETQAEIVRPTDNIAIQSGADHAEMANNVQKTAQIMEKLLDRLSQLENRFDTLPNPPKHTPIPAAPTVHFCSPINTDDNSAQALSDRIAPENQAIQIRFINPDNQAENISKSQPINTEIDTAETAASTAEENVSTQNDASPKQAPVATTSFFKNTASLVEKYSVQDDVQNTMQNEENSACTDLDEQTENQSENTDLDYPNSLNQHTCKVLSGLLQKSHGHSQDILDLLALRLENTRNPINDIVLYCSSLVRKARENALDLDALNAYRASKKPAPTAKEQQMQALRQEYQEAHAEYQHFERINKMQANSYQCSVEEYLEQSGMKKSWNDIVERLEQVKYNIEQHQ